MYILETYTVWSKLIRTLVITIRRTANDRAYSTRQHFAVLALLRAASHQSRFHVTVCIVARISCSHKDCALEPNYLKARESAKSSKISRAVSSFRYSKLERRAAAIYTEGRTLTRILLYIKHISDKLLEYVKANSNLVAAMSTTISLGSERTSTVPHRR